MREFREWQETQYRPGYWVGGKIPPFLKGKRPSKYGHVLLATGFVSGLAVALMAFSGSSGDAVSSSVFVLIAVLQLAAGARLLRRD